MSATVAPKGSFEYVKAPETASAPAPRHNDEKDIRPSRLLKKTLDFQAIRQQKRTEQLKEGKTRRVVELHVKRIEEALKKPGNSFINFFDVVLKIDVRLADRAIQRLMSSKPTCRPLIQGFIDRYMQSMMEDELKRSLEAELQTAGCSYTLASIEALMGNLHINTL